MLAGMPVNTHIRFQHAPFLSGVELIHARGAEQNIPRHFHTGYTICRVDTGQRILFLGKQQYILSAGDWMALAPGEVHRVETPGKHDYTLLSIPDSPEWWGEQKPVFSTPVFQDDSLLPLWQIICTEWDHPQSALSLETALLEFCAAIAIHHGHQPIFSPAAEISETIRQVQILLESNLAEDISLADIAAAVHYSPPHLLREFTRQAGTAPHEYRILARLRAARQFIRSGVSITETAQQTGFYDQSHFIHTFQKYMNASPHQYASKTQKVD